MKPPESEAAKRPRRLRFRDPPAALSPQSSAQAPEGPAFFSVDSTPARRKARGWARSILLSSAVFVLLGGAMGYLRYAGGLSPDALTMMRRYAPFVGLAVHAIVLVMTFEDSVYAGILAFLIPPYAYYHLFFVSDNFLMRAVVAGVLVGVGEDSGVALYHLSIQAYDKVIDWIDTGGGTFRRSRYDRP